MRTEREKQELHSFRLASQNYLDSLGIPALRAYGRYVGVARATTKKKAEIIEDIIAIFSGELVPIERSKRGAPVRDDSFDPRIEEKMNAYRFAYLRDVQGTLPISPDDNPAMPMDWSVALSAYKNKPRDYLVVESPDKDEYIDGVQKVHVGQLTTLNSVSMLLPLDCTDSEEKIVVSVDFIREFDLQEGDVISCYARKSHNIYVALRILEINGIAAEKFQRNRLEAAGAMYPHRELKVYDKGKYNAVVNKFVQWLVPFGKGQRGIVMSAPKSGKTQFLLSMAEAIKELNENVETYVLLVDQAPETVGMFRKIIPSDNLLYTTYEDDPDKQIFVASFLLKRAICQMESGKDVVLIVDSLNALAHAYNETEESSGGKLFANGLESKTIHYIKKYLGAARQTEKGGSLTILGSVSVTTGNPADEMIASELTSLCNLEIRLSDALAHKRIFPALDITLVQSKQDEHLRTPSKSEMDILLRQQYLTTHDAAHLLELLEDADSFEAFRAWVKQGI